MIVNVPVFCQSRSSGNDLLDERFTIARLKYSGGGDWYVGPTMLPNLMKFIQENTGVFTSHEEIVIEPSSPRIFNYPYLFMTGHGNVKFTDAEIQQLRRYFEQGGFLHADDNYGLEPSFRREMKRIFPETDFVELPFNHSIYHSHFTFPNGLPKIHEHDGKTPQGFGIFLDNRLVVFFSYETDLGNGWEDPEVHSDPPDKRLAALRMGTNIVIWRVRGGI